jgi:hypothetical protein
MLQKEFEDIKKELWFWCHQLKITIPNMWQNWSRTRQKNKVILASHSWEFSLGNTSFKRLDSDSSRWSYKKVLKVEYKGEIIYERK